MVKVSHPGDLSWPLERAARLWPDEVAVVCGDLSITYAELRHRVNGLGAALSELGVAAGARVGFLGVNSLAHLEAWLAVPAHGRVLVDLNFRLADAELAFMIDDCEPELLIAGEEQLERGRRLQERCASVRTLVAEADYEALVRSAPTDPPGIDEDEVATISYTGGTTGTPKGVMLSHRNLLANARHNLIATGHDRRDRWLHVCPMFHVAGTANVFACTWVGAQQIVLPRFEATAVAEAIDRHRITHTVLVPTMLGMLLDHLDEHPEADVSSLRHVQYAASPITREVQQRAVLRLGCDIVQFYGMTEAAPTVTECGAEDHRRGVAGEEPFTTRLGSVGVPVPGVEAQIRTSDGSPVPVGQVGEIWVRGPNVMLGYWRRAEATAEAFSGDWYRTGDAAYADADGYMYLVDRLRDMIVSGGENVYSIEVEAVLMEHPAVTEAAVFGVPDPRWGERVHAVVVLADKNGADEESLIEHCRAHIAGYKIPRAIELRTEPLPRSGAGKLLKHTLREPHWSGSERRVN
jgi:long-chain acyl-CoA synthetase